ncbi:DNA replication/repair protein RecF [Thiomicrospira sp. ALE5]|uniref:DNA replication/repair protein RecF n=1 Tax=Thiomicrospira sp. ALE5 TaxID=748650 RepID=UPI0008DFA1D9|nr:DNA replication/repair protein RecF [Thiomicrospira sp. ALE5]SFR56539.1 DNA replication and repair protein RecF [Thiomicrospira sp. ALE5]
MACIKQLKLQNFRNIEQLDWELDCGQNIIVGDNAAGKTAIIEALWYLASGRSFRTNKPKQLIQQDHQAFTIFCDVAHQTRQYRLGVNRDNEKTDIHLNGKKATSQSALSQCLPLQLLTPESHQLLTEGPKARRRFLDWGCFYHYPDFLTHWQQFQRALKQRNMALKQRCPQDQIALWDKTLVTAGTQINQIRMDYLHQLQPILHDFAEYLMPRFNQQHQLTLSFFPGWHNPSTDLHQILQSHLIKDSQLGHTQYGPHRMDIKIKVDQQDALSRLSRGQQKLFVCSMLLAQAQHLAEQTSESVIMLIDDLPAELDETHRFKLLNLLQEMQIQHLVSTTASELIPKMSKGKPKTIYIQQGEITLTH